MRVSHEALFWASAPRQETCAPQHPRDEAYSRATSNWVQDLVAVVQHGNVKNTFHWKPSKGVGMLQSVKMMITQAYGDVATREHRALLQTIAERGSPRHWALMWIFILSVDQGLQRYVTSAEVRSYVGTDNVAKIPSDADALFCYLRALRTEMHRFATEGVRDASRLMEAVLSWHVYGGRQMGHERARTTVLPR